MGRPVKLSDRNRPWFLRGLRCRERTLDAQDERQRFLLVCEGEKTEPNYFRALEATLPRNAVELEISGEGANTLSLVARAQERRDQRADGDYPFDQVWVIFDKNSFPPHDFDNAIRKADSDGIECAWSNEAFELWYILHFECRTTAMSRDEYKGRLTELLEQEYRKNARDMYEQLAAKGNEAQAIVWARRLDDEATATGTPPSRANPCTTVHRLVEELNRFKPPPEADANA